MNLDNKASSFVTLSFSTNYDATHEYFYLQLELQNSMKIFFKIFTEKGEQCQARLEINA